MYLKLFPAAASMSSFFSMLHFTSCWLLSVPKTIWGGDRDGPSVETGMFPWFWIWQRDACSCCNCKLLIISWFLGCMCVNPGFTVGTIMFPLFSWWKDADPCCCCSIESPWTFCIFIKPDLVSTNKGGSCCCCCCGNCCCKIEDASYIHIWWGEERERFL